VLSFLAALVATTAPAQASRTDCVPEAGWPAQDTNLAAQVIGLVNQYRASRGLSQLSVSQSLTNAAAWKASQLAADVASAGAVAFDHNDYGTGRTAQARLQACGYGDSFGENIALGQDSAQEVMNQWLASPGHKANLDYAGWQAIGVGAAAGRAGIGWVQDFGVSNPDPATTLAPRVVAPSPTTPSPATPLAPAVSSSLVSALEPTAPAAGDAPAAAPGVEISSRPRSRTRKHTARLRWHISGHAQSVSCTLNGKALRRCGFTGRTLRHVRRGRHVFRVTVSGPAGSDTAQVRWRVLRRR
jgi:uncharacterized protein YkwD